MKKHLLVTLIFVVSLSLAGVAMAGSAAKQPPTVSCWDWGVFRTVLSIKPFSGNIAISEGTTKFYAIHGELSNGSSFSAPVSGTGHMTGNIFHFSLTGTGQDGNTGRIWTYQILGFWSAVEQKGEGGYLAGVKDESASRMNALSADGLVFVPLDCKATDIPY